LLSLILLFYLYFSLVDSGSLKERPKHNITGYRAESDTGFIIDVIKNSPADKAGMQVGDRLIEINDITPKKYFGDFEKLKRTDFFEGTIEKRDGTVNRIKIKKRKFDIPSLKYEIIDEENKTGLIKIRDFADDNLHIHFYKSLLKFKDKGIKNIILDLRDNSGGLMYLGNNILSYLIDAKNGNTIEIKSENVMYRKRYGDVFDGESKDKVEFIKWIKNPKYLKENDTNDKQFNEKFNPKYIAESTWLERINPEKEFDYCVLVNEGSASTTEALALGLKEKGYHLIGKRTFGKSEALNVWKIGLLGKSIMFPIGEYRVLKKSSKGGIKPDFDVDGYMEQLKFAVNYFKAEPEGILENIANIFTSDKEYRKDKFKDYTGK